MISLLQLPWTTLRRVRLGKAILTLKTVKTFGLMKRSAERAKMLLFQVSGAAEGRSCRCQRRSPEDTCHNPCEILRVLSGGRKWRHAFPPKEGLRDGVMQMQPRTDPCPLARNLKEATAFPREHDSVPKEDANLREGATMVGPPSVWRPVVNLWAHKLHNTLPLRTSFMMASGGSQGS